MKIKLQPNESIKLTKSLLADASYQFVTKAYKVVVDKPFIGKKKNDLIEELIGKTYTEPEIQKSQLEVSKLKEKQTNFTSKEDKRQKLTKLELFLLEIKEERKKALLKVNRHETRENLQKIVCPLEDFYAAGWNISIKTMVFSLPKVTKNEKIFISKDQTGIKPDFVKIERRVEGEKIYQIVSSRNLRNINEPDWSKIESAIMSKYAKKIQLAYDKHQ